METIREDLNDKKSNAKKFTEIFFAVIAMLIFLLIISMLSGCSTTTVWEFDKEGKCVKKTETETDIAGSIIQSTKDKTVLIWHEGWAAYASVSPATFEDPTPHLKGFVGKDNRGYFAVHKDHQHLNFDGIAKVVQATKSNLNVSATGEGLSAEESSQGQTVQADKPDHSYVHSDLKTGGESPVKPIVNTETPLQMYSLPCPASIPSTAIQCVPNGAKSMKYNPKTGVFE